MTQLSNANDPAGTGSDAKMVGADKLRSLATAESPRALGGWLTVASSEYLAALSASSLDYIGIDCQHGLSSEADVARMLVEAGPSPVPLLVRVSANRTELIQRVIDAGADGVIIPLVNDAEEARSAVSAVKFPPEGVRSYGPVARHIPREPAELARRVLVLAMIESEAGVKNVNEILAVPGIDGVYVGPADLGLSLGLGHQQFPTTPQLSDALKTIAAAAHGASKIAGLHSGSEFFVEMYRSLGFTLLTMGIHSSFVLAGVERALERVNAPKNILSGTSPYG
ncbi:2-dehydro-3-deoxyglucarate aldolase [Rhizobium tropici]|uniref:2-dehydro-3-deoxyglucarate aldolase n=1 Tax=Rhizobium tropici TaxID=398 RepID=A0A5B0VQL2_RHITR|nr:aldolase/citrate lyase family protein [Rhizobium tropici]KAA1176980.1 2-dehydro-3-deoxyglucarate aldolase [Rhizobium tropici]